MANRPGSIGEDVNEQPGNDPRASVPGQGAKQKRVPTTGFWLSLTLVLAFLLGMIFFSQYHASQVDLYFACQAAGQDLDRNFRLLHPKDGSPAIPLHNRCNAVHDFVPNWVNPTLRVLVAALIITLIGLLGNLLWRRRKPGR